MSASDNALWQKILDNLSLGMTQDSFDTWLRDSRIVEHDGDRIIVAVKNAYAVDWLENRYKSVVLRAVNHVIGQPVEIQFIVNGDHQDGDAADLPADHRVAIEIVDLDITAGFVMTSNYAWQYWQPYLATVEREAGTHSPIAFCLWNTLRSFPAAWQETGRPQWPSISTLADMVARGDRCKIRGRNEYGQKRRYSRTVGALEILENEHIVWPRTVGTGRDTVYYYRVLNALPILTPAQISKLTRRLQERHERELERRKLDYDEWQQLTLPTLLEDR
jgi:hypothetical protein